MKYFSLPLVSVFLLSSCAHKAPVVHTGIRTVASGEQCDSFNHLSGKAKFKSMFKDHFSSINSMAKLSDAELVDLTDGPTEEAFNYVRDFKGSLFKHGQESADALAATTRFLIPSAITESHGHRSLKPTLTHHCEVQADASTKKVHALGSLGFAQFNAYETVTWHGQQKKNPFSGLFAPAKRSPQVALRFSIANPVAHQLSFQGKNFDLEFIPGLGMKFFIDGQKSVDLVAMESLAGQDADHNWFKYDFSSDFSRKAPVSFNTAKGNAKKQILARYEKNAVNHHVMDLVGKRFAQAIPYALPNIKPEMIPAHDEKGPHPFAISIEDLAATTVEGQAVPVASQKRPYRLVFHPALDNIEPARKAKITSSRPYVPGKVETDFRHKLASLKKGDRLFYVVAEDQDGHQYRIGEFVLQTSVLPSEFADKLYFIQHKLEFARIRGNTITHP